MNRKAFENIGRSTPYLAWSAAGLSPAEVKAEAINLLRPHLLNGGVLETLPIEVIGYEAVSISRFADIPSMAAQFKAVLLEYRKAYSADPQRSVDSFSAWQAQLLKAQSEFESLYLLEKDKSELESDEFRVEIFRDIGAILEACVQPHLKALAHQVRVRRSRPTALSLLENMTFGLIVDELSHTLTSPELVAPPPWGLKLHVYRNIAQHHSTVLRDGKILCTYSVGQTSQEISFSRLEVLSIAQTMMQTLGVLRSARTMFYLDHIDVIPDLPAAVPKPSTETLMLTVALATQGFEVVGLDTGEGQAHLLVRDVTRGDPLKRGIHASQFLVQLWILTRAPRVRVIYLDDAGSCRLVAEAKDSDCRDIAEGDTPFEALASRVSFHPTS